MWCEQSQEAPRVGLPLAPPYNPVNSGWLHVPKGPKAEPLMPTSVPHDRPVDAGIKAFWVNTWIFCAESSDIFFILSCFVANWEAKAGLSVLQNKSRHRWALPLSQEPQECFIYTHNTASNALVLVKLSSAISPPDTSSTLSKGHISDRSLLPLYEAIHHHLSPFLVCISCFAPCCDWSPDTEKLSGEGVIWVRGVRKCNPSWKGRHGGKSWLCYLGK